MSWLSTWLTASHKTTWIYICKTEMKGKSSDQFKRVFFWPKTDNKNRINLFFVLQNCFVRVATAAIAAREKSERFFLSMPRGKKIGEIKNSNKWLILFSKCSTSAVFALVFFLSLSIWIFANHEFVATVKIKSVHSFRFYFSFSSLFWFYFICVN